MINMKKMVEQICDAIRDIIPDIEGSVEASIYDKNLIFVNLYFDSKQFSERAEKWLPKRIGKIVAVFVC